MRKNMLGRKSERREIDGVLFFDLKKGLKERRVRHF